MSYTSIRIEKKTKGELDDYKRDLAAFLKEDFSRSGAIQYMLDNIKRPWLNAK